MEEEKSQNLSPESGSEILSEGVQGAALGEGAALKEGEVASEAPRKGLGRVLQRICERFRPAGPPSKLRRCVAAVFGTAFGIAFLVALTYGMCRGSIWLYGEAITSDYFTTRSIVVEGNVRLSRDMILRTAGLSEGQNCLATSIADIEYRLRSTPWVESVSVQRILPDSFLIKVHERMPSFWVLVDTKLWYANEKGEPIAPVESENFLPLPTLTMDGDEEAAVPCLARLMQDMRSGVLPVEASAIASVDVSPGRGVEIYLDERELRLSMAPDDWEGNLRRLGITISDLARRRELGGVSEVRAADGSVWVLKRRAVQ